MPGSGLLRPCSGGDAHVGLGIQFPSLAVCSRMFGVHDPCGTHNTWHRLLQLGLTSFEMAISEIFLDVPRIGPMTLRPSGG